MKLRITDGKGFHVITDSGITMSVQIGPGNYCDNYNLDYSDFTRNRKSLPPSSTAEIAVWLWDGELLTWPSGATVVGKVPIERVFIAIHLISGIEDPTPGNVMAAVSFLEDAA